MAIALQIVIDCSDPKRLATFWSAALGYKIQDPPTGFTSWEAFLEAQQVPVSEWENFSAVVDPDKKGPRIYFQRVPEPKTVKNRLHLDVNASSSFPAEESLAQVEATVQRLSALGAHELYRRAENGDFWVTMADPEGNEFCVQ